MSEKAKPSPEPQTPSAHVMAEGAPPAFVVDKKGRRIELRHFRALHKMQLAKAVGADNSNNGLYMGMAVVASHVTSIDGSPVPFPRNEAQVESIVDRLEDWGIEAIATAIAPTMTTEQEILDDAKN